MNAYRSTTKAFLRMPGRFASFHRKKKGGDPSSSSAPANPASPQPGISTSSPLSKSSQPSPTTTRQSKRKKQKQHEQHEQEQLQLQQQQQREREREEEEDEAASSQFTDQPQDDRQRQRRQQDSKSEQESQKRSERQRSQSPLPPASSAYVEPRENPKSTSVATITSPAPEWSHTSQTHSRPASPSPAEARAHSSSAAHDGQQGPATRLKPPYQRQKGEEGGEERRGFEQDSDHDHDHDHDHADIDVDNDETNSLAPQRTKGFQGDGRIRDRSEESGLAANEHAVEEEDKLEGEESDDARHGSGDSTEPRKSQDTLRAAHAAGTGSINTTATTTTTNNTVFQGLPDYSRELGSTTSLMSDEELRALGITLDDGHVTAGVGVDKDGRMMGIDFLSMPSPPPLLDEAGKRRLFEVEVSPSLHKDRRPELQVAIPLHKSSASAVASRSPCVDKSTPGFAPSSSGVSTPSTIKTGQPPRTNTPNTAASVIAGTSSSNSSSSNGNNNGNNKGNDDSRNSVVSPLSSAATDPSAAYSRHGHPMSPEPVDAPQPPKSAVSAAFKSATSMSSEDLNVQGARSSELSKRSSMSSLNSGALDAREAQPVTDWPSIHVDATDPVRFDPANNVAYQATLVTETSRGPANHQAKPVRRKNSTTSITSTSTININKPLPPEPPGGMIGMAIQRAATGASIHSRTPSRSSTVTVRQRSGSQDNGIESPAMVGRVKTVSVSRVGSVNSVSKVSLRSKYTPKDLDAMDETFQRKANAQQNKLYSNQSTPSHSQLSLVPESNSLDTIREDSSPRGSHMAARSHQDPLQISRGPMRMEPSRKPPQPPMASPQRFHTVNEKPEPRRRFMKRSQSSNHIGTQIKSDAVVHRRLSTQVTGSSSKANRILGKSGSSTPNLQDPPPRIVDTAGWTVAESPREFSRSSSPASTHEAGGTPELEATKPDAQVEEIRKRLELLSPKDDPTVTFLAFHKKNASRSDEKLDIVEEAKALRAPEAPKPPLVARQVEVAELEGARVPSVTQAEREEEGEETPVELEGSQITAPVEMGLPSPLPIAIIPIPPTPVPPLPAQVSPPKTERRGRRAGSNPQSTATATTTRSLHSQRSLKARSLASLAASEIPDMYANMPTPPNVSVRPSMTAEEVEQLISADAAEQVLLRILESLDNLQDLFEAAMVSRGFYRTFKRHEIHLLKRALYRMSPAAWELREMSIPYPELEAGAVDYTPRLYFRHYVQDMFTMVELKAKILDSCKSFLRQDTISGLAGETERSPLIDEAFWRVWTFCKIFGCGHNREDDIVGQMDWLKGGPIAQQSSDTRTLALTDELARNSVLFNPPKGFARGNGKGLTAEELYDMTEIWTCLGVLVGGYQDKRKDAREHGIFDNADIPTGDVAKENALIEEWTYYLLTLAPPVVLDVTSPTSPTPPTPATFAHVRAQGYTSWTPPTGGASRSTFLKEAVSRVYEEKMALNRPPASASPKSFSDDPKAGQGGPGRPGGSAGGAGVASPLSPEAALLSRQRVAAHAAELRAKKQDPAYKDVPVSTERPMSNYKDVLNRLEALSTSAEAPPLPKLPGLAARLSRRMPKVTVSLPAGGKNAQNSASSSATSLPQGGAQGQQQQQQQSTPSPPPPPPSAMKPSPSPTRQGAGRFSSLRDKVAAHSSNQARGESGAGIGGRMAKESVKPKDGSSSGGGGGKSGTGKTKDKSKTKDAKPNVKDNVVVSKEGNSAIAIDSSQKEVAPPSNNGPTSPNSSSAVTTATTTTAASPPPIIPQTIQIPAEKVPVVPTSPTTVRSPQAPSSFPTGPQVKDPVDLAVEKLVAMGFEESRAKKALAETDSGNHINFNGALTRLIKEKSKRERMERLDRMG